MNLSDALHHHARMRPYDLAVAHPGGSVSYAGLLAQVAVMAGRLRRHDVPPGRLAAVYVSDRYLHLLLLLALMQLGIASVSGHPNYAPLPAGLDVGVLLTDRDLPFAGAARTEVVDDHWLPTGDETRAAAPEDPLPRPPDQLARVFVSQGTTGRPQAIGHTQRSLEGMTLRPLALDRLLATGPNLTMMSLATFGGFHLAHLTLWHGATLVMMPDAGQLLRAVGVYGVRALRVSPAQLLELVDLAGTQTLRLGSLERLQVVGAALSPEVLRRARALLCPNITSLYAPAEAGPVAELPGAEQEGQPDVVGWPLPDVQLRIVDERDRPVPPGVQGIVQLRTPHMVQTYLGDAQAASVAFVDGWFVPGDKGTLMPDGMLSLRGRADELLGPSGERINAAIIEAFLLTQPGVSDAAAFAVHWPQRVDEIWAAVVCSSETDEAALRSSCAAWLGAHAPVRFLRVPKLPRDSAGKPLRTLLARHAAHSAAAQG